MCSPFNIDIRPRRLPIEVRHIEEASSGHGIHCFVNGDNYEKIDAIIPGPKETPYEGVNFRLSMEFNDQYPFRPPTIKFQTPVYHPNIDTDGKICLDVLYMPPSGSYNPAITLESILLSVQLLLASPNPDDPLRSDVSDEYKYNRDLFNEKAKRLSKDLLEKIDADIECREEADDEPKVTADATKQPLAEKDLEKKDAAAAAAGGGESSTVTVISNKPRKRKHDET